MSRAAIISCAILACLCLLPAKAQPQRRVYQFWPKHSLVDAAAVHASRFDSKKARHLRYVDLSAVPPDDRLRAIQTLGYVVNSWSTNDLIFLPQEVPGTEGALAYFDASTLRARYDEKGLEQLLEALDRLGELGSGPAPFPEPFYHLTEDVVTQDRYEDVRTWETRWDGYYQRTYRVEVVTRRLIKGEKKRKTAIGPHLNRATAIGLASVTKTNFPIFEFRWLLANGLCEPRYHELLGLDDAEASAKKLAAVDEKLADRVGAQVRGAVLWSEVAHHNRVLERTPTLLRKGRGTYQKSYDFNASVRAQDVLKDLLIDGNQAVAQEIIFNLPNGLLGFLVTDNKGKRLDKADGDVALNNRSKFRDRQVRTAFHCIACHLPDCGWIEVDDEVRALASKPVTLYADSQGGKRGDRIRQKYLDDDFNSLLRSDQAVVEAAVQAATKLDGKGLSCPQTAKMISDSIFAYWYEPLTLRQLAAELGYSQTEVAAACQTKGLDPVFAVLRAGRRGRRDSVESGFCALATVLYQTKKVD